MDLMSNDFEEFTLSCFNKAVKECNPDLGDEQLQALESMKRFIFSKDSGTAFSLIGSAGTGKTRTIGYLLDELDNSTKSYILCAPTHKAALVLRNASGRATTTLHKLLALSPNLEIFHLDFNDLLFVVKDPDKLMIPYGGVIICDESSMINDDLFELLIDKARLFNAKIIFVGDKCQLQPVNARKTSKVFDLENRFTLTKIYRQSDKNSLLPVLSTLRNKVINHFNSSEAEEGSVYCFDDTKDFIKKAFIAYKEAIDSKNILATKILAYTNKRVAAYNNCIKKLLFNSNDEYSIGEFLTAYETLEHRGIEIYNSMDYIITDVSETNICIPDFATLPGYSLTLYDSYSKMFYSIEILSREIDEIIMNSLARYIESVRVKALEAKKMKQIYRSKECWRQYYNIMESFTTPVDLYYDGRLVRGKSFDYGYACSVHKSQGSTLDSIFVDMKNINICRNLDEKRQLQYVALSRTKSNAYILQ